MKHLFICIISLIFIFSSCNSQTDTAKSKNNSINLKDDSAVLMDVTGCYMQTIGRDTILAILEQRGETVTGKLKFDNYQIDGSSGTLHGVVEGDILKLNYDFFSEGMNSIMDIYFKVENNTLIRGVGDMKTNGDSTTFINEFSIEYPLETVLKKANCEVVKF